MKLDLVAKQPRLEGTISPTRIRVRGDRVSKSAPRLPQGRIRIFLRVESENGFEIDPDPTIAVERLDLRPTRRIDETHGWSDDGLVSTALSNHTVHAMSECSGRSPGERPSASSLTTFTRIAIS